MEEKFQNSEFHMLFQLWLKEISLEWGRFQSVIMSIERMATNKSFYWKGQRTSRGQKSSDVKNYFYNADDIKGSLYH